MTNTLLHMKWLREAALTLASAMLFVTVSAGATDGFIEVVHVDFSRDTPG